MKLTVSLSQRSYPILLGAGIAAALPARLRSAFPDTTRFGLVTNTTLYKRYAKLIARWKGELKAVVCVLPDGERYKTVATWNRVLDTFLAAKFERSGVIIAFGGGVVGDIAGFAAATILRGVSYAQVPTTLLAMVDSSVGGKTGVDHRCGKNLIGSFYQPSLVLIDTDFLKTLPEREYRAGYAELFKYAFIGGQGMFEFVLKNHAALLKHEQRALLTGIEQCLRIKAAVVSEDEREVSGMRALLNFGHTFAHALEKVFGFGKLLHGEAVWRGMACACELGKIIGTIPARAIDRYEALAGAMLRPRLPFAPSAENVYRAMFHDKKVRGGRIRFVLPARPGQSVVSSDVPEAAVRQALRRTLGR